MWSAGFCVFENFHPYFNGKQGNTLHQVNPGFHPLPSMKKLKVSEVNELVQSRKLICGKPTRSPASSLQGQQAFQRVILLSGTPAIQRWSQGYWSGGPKPKGVGETICLQRCLRGQEATKPGTPEGRVSSAIPGRCVPGQRGGKMGGHILKRDLGSPARSLLVAPAAWDPRIGPLL